MLERKKVNIHFQILLLADKDDIVHKIIGLIMGLFNILKVNDNITKSGKKFYYNIDSVGKKIHNLDILTFDEKHAIITYTLIIRNKLLEISNKGFMERIIPGIIMLEVFSEEDVYQLSSYLVLVEGEVNKTLNTDTNLDEIANKILLELTNLRIFDSDFYLYFTAIGALDTKAKLTDFSGMVKLK